MRGIIGIIVMLLLTGCGGRHQNKVVFHLNGAFNRHFVIERVGYNDEKSFLLDSGVGRSNRDSFIYYLPPSEAAVYQIRLQGKSFQLPFIYDSSGLGVFYNYTTGAYHYEHSPASDEWKRFQQGQLAIGRKEKALDSLLRESYTRNYAFADTVGNPALFLLAYNLVEFGRDYDGLAQFVERAGRRFPRHSGVQILVRNTLDYVKTFRSPLQVGDRLPSLELQDTAGRVVRIASIPDKYLLIDFWSTWCDQCRIFSDAKKKAYQLSDTSHFAIISIAIDAEKEAWHQVIRYEHYSWEQLIDEKMWSGPAARTFRFDSIPYNLLIGPDGRIIARAISADSLLRFVRRLPVAGGNGGPG